VAALVREIMADRAQWTGSASDLLQVGTNRAGTGSSSQARSARTGTGALIAQTMLPQNSRQRSRH
jgi:hypothetical protein